MTNAWNGFDLAMLVVVLLSTIVGAWRGVVFELMSLLGWFAAYFAAQWLTLAVAPQVPLGVPGSPLNHAAAFALIFVAALIVWALLARLLRALIHAALLGSFDRMLGAVFGALRGLVLLLAVAAVITRTPWVELPVWQQSRGAAVLKVLSVGLGSVLPPRMGGYLQP
jgi:membrane protein required for colicin V production